jgi:AcrR family transcriptional regulator
MSSVPSLKTSESTRSARPLKGGFHHGNLKQALVQAALVCPDIEGLSINQLAAGVGVTPAAVYRHFGSREDLLDEVAQIGFDRLEARFAEVFDIARPPGNTTEAKARLEGLAHAYLAFADDATALWRLMFGTQASAYRSKPRVLFRPNSYDYLPAALLGLHLVGVIGRAPDDRDALFAWSAVHGAAMLRAGNVSAAHGSVTDLAVDVADRIVRSLVCQGVLASDGQGLNASRLHVASRSR